MRRKKLTPSEIKILDRLIYPESFEVILEETSLEPGEIRDDLINLVNHRLIEVVNTDQPEPKGTSFYDSDNLKNTSFRITQSGIKHMKKQQ